MAVYITIRYYDQSFNSADVRNENKYVSSSKFPDLFEMSEFYHRTHKLYTSFVHEFKVSCEPTLSSEIQAYKGGLKGLLPFTTRMFKKYVLQDAYLHRKDYWRGPSKPFAPSEARSWASNWKKIIEKTSTDDLGAILSDEDGASRSQALEDLEAVLRIADHAERDRKKLVLEVNW